MRIGFTFLIKVLLWWTLPMRAWNVIWTRAWVWIFISTDDELHLLFEIGDTSRDFPLQLFEFLFFCQMAVIRFLFRGDSFKLVSFAQGVLFELLVEKLVLSRVERLFPLPLEFTFLQVFTYQSRQWWLLSKGLLRLVDTSGLLSASIGVIRAVPLLARVVSLTEPPFRCWW